MAMQNSSPQEMKVVFVGRRNAFNMGIVDWLDEHYSFCAAFFIEEDRRSLRARIRKIMERTKRRGIPRAVDELLFQGFYRLLYGLKEKFLWSARMPVRFRNISTVAKPCYSCDDIHRDYWLQKLRDIAPDIIFGVCTHTIFKPSLFTIPKFGMFMLHEGITPEYRGLHTPAWALLQQEPEYIGYTLLKIDEGIDSGPILCQGRCPDVARFGFCWSFIGHMALVYGLPDIKKALDTLLIQGGIFQEIPQSGRVGKNYSWVPLSDYIRLKLAGSTSPK
jgi:methionyl-tRNA formyltransferase